MPAEGQTPPSENGRPADDHRFDAEVVIKPGETEGRSDGSGFQLVRLVLTDNGPVTRPDGTTYYRPDVICPMRPEHARVLAERLGATAASAERYNR